MRAFTALRQLAQVSATSPPTATPTTITLSSVASMPMTATTIPNRTQAAALAWADELALPMREHVPMEVTIKTPLTLAIRALVPVEALTQTTSTMPPTVCLTSAVAPVFVVGGGQQYCKIVNSSMLFPNI